MVAPLLLLPLVQGSLVNKTQVDPSGYVGKRLTFFDDRAEQCYHLILGGSFLYRTVADGYKGTHTMTSAECHNATFLSSPPYWVNEYTFGTYSHTKDMQEHYYGGDKLGSCDTTETKGELYTVVDPDNSFHGIDMFLQDDPDTCTVVFEIYFPYSTSSSDGPVVHGDPMFKVNGTGTHLWIAAGQLTPLLQWKARSGSDMQLLGKTVSRPTSGNQWFNQFVVKQDDAVVLNATINQATSNMDVLLDEHVVNPWRRDERSSAVKHSHRKGLSLFAHEFVNNTEKTNQVHVYTGGVFMTLYPSLAHKFVDEFSQHKYQHLNIRFSSPLPMDSTGIFAEVRALLPPCSFPHLSALPGPHDVEHRPIPSLFVVAALRHEAHVSRNARDDCQGAVERRALDAHAPALSAASLHRSKSLCGLVA